MFAGAVVDIVRPDIPMRDAVLMQIQQSPDELEAERFVLSGSPVHLCCLAEADDFVQGGRTVLPQNNEALILLVLIQAGLNHECVLVGVAISAVLFLQRFLQHGHLVEPSFEGFLLVAGERDGFYEDIVLLALQFADVETGCGGVWIVRVAQGGLDAQIEFAFLLEGRGVLVDA
jgi:hypothetical protein